MILIYTDNITPRLTYSFELVFKSVLNIDYEITNDIEKYNLFEGNKFAYCHTSSGFESYIKANDLLFETTIKKIELEQKSIKNNLPIFLKRIMSLFFLMMCLQQCFILPLGMKNIIQLT